MTKDIQALQKKLYELEPLLEDELIKVTDTNSLLSFQFSYISNYLPTLEYVVEYLKENEIANFANFGITIDNMLSIKFDELLRFRMAYDIREFSKGENDEKKNGAKSELLKALERINVSQKLQMSVLFTSQMSAVRDQLLTQASSKFDPINKVITWANFFSHFISNPILCDHLLDEETIAIAEKDLKEAQKRIQMKNNKEFDYSLAMKWNNRSVLNEKKMIDIPKYFIGPKLAWLEAMVGLNVAKAIKKHDKKSMENVSEYTERILDCLSNDFISKKKYAYRENLDSAGPTFDIKKILQENTYAVTLLDNMSILFENKKVDNDIFIIFVPSSISFFTNENTKIKRELKDNEGNTTYLDIPVCRDIYSMIEFGRSPALFWLNYHQYLCTPIDSNLFNFYQKFSSKIIDIIKKSKTIIGKIDITYSDFVNNKVLEVFKNVKATSLQVLLAYGFLYVFEELAIIAGFDVLSGKLWSLNRLTIAGILTKNLQPFEKTVEKHLNKENHEIRNRIKRKIEKPAILCGLEKDIEEFTEFTSSLSIALKDDIAVKLQNINFNIQKILKSGLPVEEIHEKLQEYYGSLN